MTSLRPALVAPLLALGLLTGCAGSSEDEPAPDAPSVAASEEFNAADVTFATDMIPHHAQALEMVDMTMDRSLSPEVADLVEQIRGAQAPEIEQMSDWLVDWDQPVPETSRDHMNAGGHGEDHGSDSGSSDLDHDMPGMMSGDEMDDLEQASDADFERMWLEMMVAHHEGAIEMARTEVSEGEFPDATALAQSIADSQQAEIEQMQAMLG